MNDKESFNHELACEGICPYKECKCQFLEEAMKLEKEELPPQGIYPGTKQPADAIFSTEETATMTSYHYNVGSLPQYAYAACDDVHLLKRIDLYDHLRGVDLNWGNANREQFYGVAKSYMEYLLISLVDDIEELDVTLEVKVKPKTRETADYIISQWKEAVARFHESYGDELASKRPSAMDESQGGANEN